MSDDDNVDCATHGRSSATYVCEHLLNDPVQRWFCNPPAEDDHWPDAWCGACEDHFQHEGEWNDNNSKHVKIKILCSGCYESKKARSVDAMTRDQADRWAMLVSEAHEEFHLKQDSWRSKFKISEHKRWDWYQETGQLVFSTEGVAAVRCRFAFIGSISTSSKTWLWSWANFSDDENVRIPMDAVRKFGVEHDFPKLYVPKWVAEEQDGWQMAWIAVKVLGAKGVYRTPSDFGFSFLAILDAEWLQ